MKVLVAFFLLGILSFTPLSQAMTEAQVSKLLPAQNCFELRCVRANIDILDAEIVELLGQRLTYVKRAGKLKKDRQAVHDPEREKQILSRVYQLALKEGYPGSIAVEVYKTLLVQTNRHEMEG